MTKSLCKIDTCRNTAAKTGLCSTHYKLRNTADANKILSPRSFGIESRLTLHSKQEGECLVWTAGTYPNGYPKMNVEGVSKLAHRVAYEFAFGPIPENHELHHICENPKCINSLHLRLSTRKQHLALHYYPRNAKGRFISHEK